MAELLKGNSVVEELREEIANKVFDLKRKEVTPTLAILRVGENPSDLSYEKSVIKKAGELGIEVLVKSLDLNVKQEEFDNALYELNDNDKIHGILMFRPLPKQLDEEKARNMIKPDKDIDGCGDTSLAGIFTNTSLGYPPCTAEACLKILDTYDIDITGKNVCVIGRSLVIGKPVSMMLLNRNATVTICHSKTENVAEIASKSDILVSCIGKLGYVTSDFANENQIIIDVGINWNEKIGKISGDVDFDNVSDKVSKITPVPGGVGGVTSMILLKHVVEAAEK